MLGVGLPALSLLESVRFSPGTFNFCGGDLRLVALRGFSKGTPERHP